LRPTQKTCQLTRIPKGRNSYGNARPSRDFPALCRQYLAGELKLDQLITARIPLEDINDGFDALREKRAIRTVIVLD
jgi:S-(hydroxymethyl)glutathione dehydrogenase/alcohol dehydrogenase